MPQNRPEMEKIWDLIADYRRMDSEGLIHSMAHHLEFSQYQKPLYRRGL